MSHPFAPPFASATIPGSHEWINSVDGDLQLGEAPFDPNPLHSGFKPIEIPLPIVCGEPATAHHTPAGFTNPEHLHRYGFPATYLDDTCAKQLGSIADFAPACAQAGTGGDRQIELTGPEKLDQQAMERRGPLLDIIWSRWPSTLATPGM